MTKTADRTPPTSQSDDPPQEWIDAAKVASGQLQQAFDEDDRKVASQSDEALVEELARVIYGRQHDGLKSCYQWDDFWEENEFRRDGYIKDARAILPIITAREAAAHAAGRKEGQRNPNVTIASLAGFETGLAEGRREGIEEAAKAMENLCFFTDIDEQLAMTKQDMSVRTCHEGAKAIRALAEKQG